MVKKEKESSFFVSPQNKMNEKEAKKYVESYENEESSPVFKLKEGIEMPLYIFGTNFSFMKTIETNLMIIIQHHIKENQIEIKGRIRYESTGNKTYFGREKKEKYTERNLELFKKEIKQMAEKIESDLPFKQTRKPFEINFNVNEPIESIMKKLNDSNEFNIGTVDKKK